jgi:hypothetical protein
VLCQIWLNSRWSRVTGNTAENLMCGKRATKRIAEGFGRTTYDQTITAMQGELHEMKLLEVALGNRSNRALVEQLADEGAAYDEINTLARQELMTKLQDKFPQAWQVSALFKYLVGGQLLVYQRILNTDCVVLLPIDRTTTTSLAICGEPGQHMSLKIWSRGILT